jgi:hypothetical protein
VFILILLFFLVFGTLTFFILFSDSPFQGVVSGYDISSSGGGGGHQ